MFLYQSRYSIEVTRASVRSQRAPLGRCRTSRVDRRVNIGGAALRHGSQLLPSRRVKGVEIFSSRRRLPGAIDKESKAATVALQPSHSLLGILRSRTVFHRHEFFGNAHSASVRFLNPKIHR